MEQSLTVPGGFMQLPAARVSGQAGHDEAGNRSADRPDSHYFKPAPDGRQAAGRVIARAHEAGGGCAADVDWGVGA